MQTILLESVPVYDAAVLYTAESSWAGPAQTAAPIVRALESRQVSTVVLPYETWASEGEIKDGRWDYHGQSFSLVVLPSVSYVPAQVMKRLADFAEQGGRVVVIDRWPEGSVDGRADGDVIQAVERLKRAPGASLCALPDIGEITAGISSIRFTPGNQRLMISRRKAKDGEWLLIHNRSLDADAVGNLIVREALGETAHRTAETIVPLGAVKSERLDANKVVHFDAEQGKYFNIPFIAGPRGLEVALNMPPGALWVLRLGTNVPDAAALPDFKNRIDVNTEWDVIELDDSGKETGKTIHVTKLEDWRRWKDWSQFAGTLRYRATIDLASVGGPIFLDAGRVGEIVELRINGRPAGVRLSPPYVWDITALVHPGKNTIELDITNTAQSRWSDPFSRGNAVNGLLGPVIIAYYFHK
jgi:hypothetical protein